MWVVPLWKGMFELMDDEAIDTQALECDRTSRDVAAKAFEFVVLVGFTGNGALREKPSRGGEPPCAVGARR